MVDSDWLTVTAAARRLGITRTAVYNRIKRGSLSVQVDNHGHQLVNVGVTVTRDTLRNVTRDTVSTPLNQERPAEPPGKALGGTELIPVSVLHETVKALQASHREALALMVERVDAAELRAERVEQRLDQVLDHLIQQQSAGGRERPASWLRWRWWR